MVTVTEVDTRSREEVRRFVDLPYRLYSDDPQWVPPLKRDVAAALDKSRHPFYEHSDGAFFLARRDGAVLGRIAVLENRRYNSCHATRQADFYYFECENNPETASALFESAFRWARARGLTRIVGPKGLSPFDGYGLLVQGFDRRQMMTMVNHNLPYYPELLEGLGFRKEVDFVSAHICIDEFHMSERIARVAARVQARGTLRVQRFRQKRELLEYIPRIAETYNHAFVHNWEYHPLSRKEVDYVVGQLLSVADPRLIKVIMHGDEIAGFILAFPDISAALQRMRGHLLPFGVFHVLRELRRADWLALNGAGVLPRFQGCGGNALLYSEIEKTVRESGYHHAHLTQIAESAVQMRRDMQELGARPVKTHRVFCRPL